ncbi:glucose-1-phosphate cytidylyltransferase [Novosphingobium sp. JCM 18896]|uniref:glucose-1-phosphate cytidylyltransferase n=1 Tax=Novosphingobium sp. JCM 18896 TaxID=2989731 RepID=UPI002222A4E6|nr:glucose-1-phosphate cytidylyltransferase [Novosphingobium sp. JCM 18896]MCW1429341.1 glucose-1-phosphate cytidylyltransferase [Novosphingobium sp. JCM 18896]
MPKAVILAGGLGTRLGEETSLRPKPMVEIGGMPILWHIMKIYSAHGVNDFVVCLGYKGYMIKEFFANYFLHAADVTIDLAQNSLEVHEKRSEPWKITLVETGAETQTGGRLKTVRKYLADDEPFLMTYGDGVSSVDVTAQLAFHKAHGRKSTITAVAPPGRFGALEFDGDKVTAFREKPAGDGGLINGGFFVLEPSVIDLIDAPETLWEKEPMETLAASGEMVAWRHEGFWQPMDTLRDKQNLEQLWQDGAPWKIW